MPRTAKDAETGQEITLPDDDERDFDEPSEAEIDREMAVNNWIADLGGHDDAALVVYELDPKTNKPVYIESLGAQEMDGPTLFQKLKNEYGGGKFRIQMRADGRIRKTQTVEVKPPPKVEQHSNGFGGTDLPALIREIRGQENRGSETQIIMQAMQQQNQQFQMMMVEMVKAMGANNSNQPAPPSMTDIIGSVAALQKMATPAQQKDPTDLILKGIELATALKSDDSGEANMYTLLNSAVKELGGVIGEASKVMPNMIANPTQAKPEAQTPMQITAQDTVRPREPVSGGDEPAPQIETTSRNEIPDQLKPFEPYVNTLVQFAAQDKDPDLYAEVIIDQMGDEYALAWVGQREGREMLLGIFTQAQPFAAWFEKVGNVIAEILEETDETPPIDGANEPAQNAGEVSQDGTPDAQVNDVPNGPDNPAKEGGTRDPSIDGDSERPGGDSANATIDGETSQPIQDPS